MDLNRLLNDANILDQALAKVAIRGQEAQKRYVSAIRSFREYFNDDDISIFKTPGRIEICGNHTDHQNGQIIAAAIDVDAIAIVSRADDITIRSAGFDLIKIDIEDIACQPSEYFTSIALIKGVLYRFKQLGLNIGGFNAYIASDINVGSGMSSSANFTVMIATILNQLYNDNMVDRITMAKIAQYSEVNFFNKPCGLMDQLACAIGGIIHVDFKDIKDPKVTKVDNVFKANKQVLALVMTRSSHENLSDEYAAIVKEMKLVAARLDKKLLAEVEQNTFYDNLDKLIDLDNDRALLRAHHFFSENERVEKLIRAINHSDIQTVYDLLKKSGHSSYMYLQNIYLGTDPAHQNVALTLAMSEYFFEDSLAFYRVHGGGFGGTILAGMDQNISMDYKRFIEKITGEDTCRFINIDEYGSICILV